MRCARPKGQLPRHSTWQPERTLDYRGVNALAETVIGLFKTEVIHRNGLRRGFDDVELATLEWVARLNKERMLAPLG
jgi:hypothetical protein